MFSLLNKHLITLYHSPSTFKEPARFATEGSCPSECFGMIGKDGHRFCLIQGCETNHQGGTFDVPPNHLFIKSSATEAFCSLCRCQEGLHRTDHRHVGTVQARACHGRVGTGLLDFSAAVTPILDISPHLPPYRHVEGIQRIVPTLS